MDKYDKVIRAIKKFGCSFVHIDSAFLPDNIASPFDGAIGLDWDGKVVYSSAHAKTDSPETWCGLIHELGHAVASTHPPDDSPEFDFFGWEYIVAKKCGLTRAEFIDGNGGYGTQLNGVSKRIEYLSLREFNAVISDRKKVALASGLLLKVGSKYEPTVLR